MLWGEVERVTLRVAWRDGGRQEETGKSYLCRVFLSCTVLHPVGALPLSLGEGLSRQLLTQPQPTLPSTRAGLTIRSGRALEVRCDFPSSPGTEAPLSMDLW